MLDRKLTLAALQIQSVETEDSSLFSHQPSHLLSAFDDKKTLISILKYACCPWQVGSERNDSDEDCLGAVLDDEGLGDFMQLFSSHEHLFSDRRALIF